MSQPWSLIPQGLVLSVHVQPRAAHDRLVGFHGKALKITLTAPPRENAANTALLTFLANLLQVPRAAVSLLAGAKSREKRVQILAQNPAVILQRLEQSLARVDKKKSDG
jgi:uncharacterized protein (TIGR00251 family)